MINKKKEDGNILKKLLWWIPIIILGLMFALGACTKQEAKKESLKAESTQAESAQKESGEKESKEETTYNSKKSRKEKKKKNHTKESNEETTESAQETTAETEQGSTYESRSLNVEENGNYTSKEEVALYIHTYGKLPVNYITKKQAEELGWDPEKGNLSDILPGMSIGGNVFGNYEGALPRAGGRRYFECDIDYEGGYRGAKRIVYSNDGLVFYTEDHYNTFEQIY
ncbi:ribonuclease [Lachnoanaerobaculum sp. Marseille-Q4761]|jgi:ribonuclease|uniref:ribonuclease domain-containing protein n=1 Tax=Lachnoanaerobaculum sp. Marseille-Q4761 TaxID=2819511 RepID=UPI001AA10297|nr:ribonuclease domain-containing protein [Lachnoanaerobaculum sp. Marseille-Q4761]MBO1872089.1 ribonuclease [Lachnoanaerobaculum sp. Marseille-Q4761]